MRSGDVVMHGTGEGCMFSAYGPDDMLLTKAEQKARLLPPGRLIPPLQRRCRKHVMHHVLVAAMLGSLVRISGCCVGLTAAKPLHSTYTP